jgi:hypothetical protein
LYEIILVNSAQIGDINSKIKLTTAREITQISYIINSNFLWLPPFDKGMAFFLRLINTDSNLFQSQELYNLSWMNTNLQVTKISCELWVFFCRRCMSLMKIKYSGILNVEFDTILSYIMVEMYSSSRRRGEYTFLKVDKPDSNLFQSQWLFYFMKMFHFYLLTNSSSYQ